MASSLFGERDSRSLIITHYDSFVLTISFVMLFDVVNLQYNSPSYNTS